MSRYGNLQDIWNKLEEIRTLLNSNEDGLGLAIEAKQDDQITNQGTETTPPPLGTKILGWLQSIWTDIQGQTTTLENNEENTFNINEKIIVDTDDDSIAVEQQLPTNINLLYGWQEQEGGVWKRVRLDDFERLKISQDSQPLPTGAATEVTLVQIRDYVDLIETLLTSLDGKDYATQTTLALIKAKTDNIDVALSTRLSKADFEARINTFGQKTSAQSTPVVIASDQSAIPVTGSFTPTTETVATTTTTNPAVTTTVSTIIASNVNRKGAMIYNNGTQTAYIKLGAGASLTSYVVKLNKEDYFEFPKPIYTGIVTAITGAGSTDLMVTEY